MPELPEVETIMRGLEAVIVCQEVTQVCVNRYDLRKKIPADFVSRVAGAQVLSCERRGKYILVHMNNDVVMIWHMGMSGRVRVYESGMSYEAEKHDHVVFYMQSGAAIVFQDPRRFGMLYLSTQDCWKNEAPFVLMGPEPLGNSFSAESLYDSLRGKKTPIKVALLDQRLVAGVGNIYACEALYEASIHPARRCCDLDLEECNALVSAIRNVLKKAILAGGSTLKDYVHVDGSLGYFQTQFSVYDKEKESCPMCDLRETCGIEKIVQAGRSTFYCARKQR